eukprot:12365531-Alexandrium_andersonii.AAC.1
MWDIWTRDAEAALTRAGVLASKREVARGEVPRLVQVSGVAEGCEGASLLERQLRRGITWVEEARRLQHEG